MEKNHNYGEDSNWKIFRGRVCIRILLIFLGIIFMQALAYMICVIGIIIWSAFMRKDGMTVVSSLVGVNMSGTFLIMVSLVSAVLSMLWCGILYKKSSWREKNFDYKAALSFKNMLSASGIGVGGCIMLTMFLTLLASLMPRAFSFYNTIMNQLTDSSMIVTVLYVLLIGPVSEELIFRGAILDRFYLVFPFFTANLLQAALFGIYHMNLIQGLYAFCLGAMLGMIRYSTGTILVSIYVHILFNGTSYILDFLFPEGQEMYLWQMIALAAGGILLFLFGFVHFLRIHRQKGSAEIMQN